MESPRRSIVKAFVWNALGLVVTSFIAFAMTGSLALGGALAAVNTAIGVAMYFIYERVWAQVSWGRHE